MALQVTLIKKPDTLSESGSLATLQTFDSQGGTLGRSASNTWVLPDPDRFLSSCHCEILFADNQYFIVDLSTNGTFINGSPEPLGKGMKAPLADGDSFEIGDYQFSVALLPDNAGFASSPFSDANAGAGLDTIISAGGSTPFADPFANSGPMLGELSLSPEVEISDPLAALDRLAPAGRPELKDDPLFGMKDDSLFGPAAPPPVSGPFAGMGQVDQSPSLDQALAWPESSQQELIPDDWADDLLGDGRGADALGGQPAPQPAAVPAASRPQTPQPGLRSPARPDPQSARASIPSADIAPEPVSSLAFDSPPEVPIPTPRRPAANSRADSPASNSPPAPPAQAQPTSAAARPARGGQVDRQFAAAMGLDTDALSDEQISAINEMGGRLMREIVEGMMQVLRSRASIKNEFRMNVTTIEPFENNPLKFSVGVDEALENMFLKKSKAYKEPIGAFRESFQEIGEHQVAMIAGIRSGFEKMMGRFDPEKLESMFRKQGKTSPIPGVQKAKFWTSYSEYFGGFSDNLESSFQNLFGSDFVQAYEDQLRRLAAARKKPN